MCWRRNAEAEAVGRETTAAPAVRAPAIGVESAVRSSGAAADEERDRRLVNYTTGP